MQIIKKISLLVVLLLIAVGITFFVKGRVSEPEGDQVFCTMEALICPDGSYVGRSGPKCAFTACPNQRSFTGILKQDSDGFRLITAAPEVIINSATYAMPLDIKVSNALSKLIDKNVEVRGTFTEGSRLEVKFLEATAPDNVIGIGETKYVGGIKITLNSIVSDSRCPIDVQCIQAGWVTANVTLLSDTDKETADMSSNKPPKAFDSFEVSIAEVRPVRISTLTPTPDSYKIVFEVEPLR